MAAATNGLDALKHLTVVVADSGDYEEFKDLGTRDATTNPSLIYLAAQKPKYKFLLDKIVTEAKALTAATIDQKVTYAMDHLNVAYGVEILKLVPGRVSTEVDARLSFDVAGTIAKAREIIGIYERAGIPKDRILVKLACTWEGCQAAKVLEAEGIHCNMTLIFSLTQAIACAEVGATLISPFVGRITDYFKQRDHKDFLPAADPGVISVSEIFGYYKAYGYRTEVMGASFRSKEQVLQLAGCDLLTVAPKLLEEIKLLPADAVSPKLIVSSATAPCPKVSLDEKAFRWAMNENEMATIKLADGIRRFGVDIMKLEADIKHLLLS
ncbi:transaldolase B [Pelomyxa schiedti]|nr:transaldolase B [Pelomyxa schiedti]